jgi:hypothetical protein
LKNKEYPVKVYRPRVIKFDKYGTEKVVKTGNTLLFFPASIELLKRPH